MKRTNRLSTRLLWGVLLLGITLHGFALPGDARAEIVNVNIPSKADSGWSVYDSTGKLISDPTGKYPIPPENVCLNDNSPLPCPTGAIKYGHISPGVWSADLSPIPGATWIWAPNITGQTSPAANAEYTFIHDIPLCNPRQDGAIYIAVDDSAQVFLNGNLELTTNSNQLTRKTISVNKLNGVLTSGFPPKTNTIKIVAKNAYLDWCANTDNYKCNPAGLVFGTWFPDDEPSCTKDGKTLRSGDFETNCPPGQFGVTGRCLCGWFEDIKNGCVAPPPTCSGANGKIYQLNDPEPLSCPAPKVGSASHTCQANGWGPADYSKCKMTCRGSNGKIYLENESEPVSCPAPKVGSASHTCQPNGAWGTPNYSACTLPVLGVGDQCYRRYDDSDGPAGDLGVCPAGTECNFRKGKCTQQCFLFICWDDCPKTVSTYGYCDLI